jgi:hypothetical protein
MLLKNWALFKIRSRELHNKEHVENILLQDIIEELNKRGIECSEIKIGHFCKYTICKVRDREVSVAIFSVIKEPDSSFRSSISCRNHLRIPWWERLFTRVPRQVRDSGEALQHLCEHVKEILGSNPRIDQVRWLTREEYFDATRPSFWDIELESYIKKHTKKRK